MAVRPVKYTSRTVFGPFYRRQADKGQDPETLRKQLSSGEVWGEPARNGGAFPGVRAYRVPSDLPEVEFYAFSEPDLWAPVCVWRVASSTLHLDEEAALAKLEVAFTRLRNEPMLTS